jgi:hypothetical protein
VAHEPDASGYQFRLAGITSSKNFSALIAALSATGEVP